MLTGHVFPQAFAKSSFRLHSRSVSIMSTSPTSPPTNLPDPSFTPILTSYVTREIDAPLETVWQILSDFTKYPDW